MFLLKLGVTVLILYSIFSRYPISGVLKTIVKLPAWLLLFMAFTTIIKHFTQYRNWRLSLQLNPVYQRSRKNELSSYLIGIPLRFMIPGGAATYGKMFFVQNSSKMASAMSVTSEKFFMTWTSWLYASLAVFFYYPLLPFALRILIIALCMMIPIGAYMLLGRFEKSKKIQPEYLKIAPMIMGNQILYVFITILQMWQILRIFEPIGFFPAAIRIALMNFANTIPITISGLGLREGFAIHFFKTAGINAEIAVSATLCLFIFHDLIPALIGSIVLLRTKKVSNA